MVESHDIEYKLVKLKQAKLFEIKIVKQLIVIYEELVSIAK